MPHKPKFHRSQETCVEYLEKRIAPATFIVTTLADAGAGSLRQAVINSNGTATADTIVFQAGLTGEILLTTGDIDITDSVNIKGPGTGKIVIDGNNTSRIFNIDDGTATVKNVTISGLSMVEGNSGASAGGGIFSRESLTLVNSVVSGCASTGDGAGIAVDTDGKLIIKTSKLTGNTGASRGGGIFANADLGIQIISSTIAGNSANRGGGIETLTNSNATGDVLIDKCLIINNTALSTTGGGGILDNDREVGSAEVGKITIRSTQISGNSAATEGGGLYLDDGFVTIDRCTISNNVAADLGGGIGDDLLNSLTIAGSKIVNNTTTNAAGVGGGGIYIQGTHPVTIQTTVISGNDSASDGGGIVALDATLNIKTSTVSGNTANGDDGGGVFAGSGATVNLTSSTFSDNRAASAGGGLFTSGTGADTTNVNITGCLFTGNEAAGAVGFGSGGAVDTLGDGAVVIKTSKFIGNTADDDGGGLYLRTNTSISITSSLISGNVAGDDGGGLALTDSTPGTPILIKSTTIQDNVAFGDDGGGVAHFQGQLNFMTSKILNNVANDVGGGIFNQTALSILLNGSKVTGNTARTDPEISGLFTP